MAIGIAPDRFQLASIGNHAAQITKQVLHKLGSADRHAVEHVERVANIVNLALVTVRQLLNKLFGQLFRAFTTAPAIGRIS